jgi:uncharacterized protein (UPF0147 family)
VIEEIELLYQLLRIFLNKQDFRREAREEKKKLKREEESSAIRAKYTSFLACLPSSPFTAYILGLIDYN